MPTKNNRPRSHRLDHIRAVLETLPPPAGYITTTGQEHAKGIPEDGQRILNAINEMPQIHTMTPRQARDARQRRGNPWDHPSAAAVEKQNIEIPVVDGFIDACIYRPESSEPHMPALVYFHGGGFVLGDIESYDKVAGQLAKQSGIVTISVGYRLAPEHPFPTPLEDARHSFLWIHRNAEALGIDADRLAIGGDSAGANLAIATCILNRDTSTPLPQLQLLLYPSTIGNHSSPSRERYAERLLLTADIIQWFHGHYVSEENQEDPRFYILSGQDLSGVPPAFVVTCGFDPLRDEGEAYAQALRSRGIAVRHSCYSNMFHGFINFGVLEPSRTAITECATVLKEVFTRNGLR